jgi:riboflavin synthase
MEVNLEYALAAGEPLGGHIVQGHVDEVGIVTEVTPIGDMHRLTVQLGDATRRVTVERGSLAIDGVSLTVAALAGDIAEFAIIPYTWSRTTLRHLERGSHVNVEADLIGKYVDRLIEPYRAQGAVSPELSALADSQNDTDRLSDD